MARSSTFPLVDRILDGQLADLLTTWRGEGATFQDIAYRLRADHDIKVSIATVQRWVEQVEAEPTEASA